MFAVANHMSSSRGTSECGGRAYLVTCFGECVSLLIESNFCGSDPFNGGSEGKGNIGNTVK